MSPRPSPQVAYFGDTSLPGPASYLAGILTHAGRSFIHVPSDQPPPEAVFAADLGLYVFSDYPSARLDAGHWRRLTARLDAGAGLLMLGGWESFHGLGGDWDRTPLAPYLPVAMLATDDRRNWPCAILLRVAAAHPVLAGLSFAQPPSIGGYNEFRPRPGALVVLEGERILATVNGDGFTFSSHGRLPLLVTSPAGPRRACLATDVAPHWVGGLVDWGDHRVSVAMGADSIEVGSGYLRFFSNLIAWCLGENPSGDPS